MPLKTLQEQPPELNLTPMIDIVFLLIIFFMVGTKFAEMERTVDLNVPQVRSLGALNDPTSKHIVNVYQDGTVFFDSQAISVPQLTVRLREAATEQPGIGVIVRGDGSGTFQNVADVLTACREAGIRDLGVSVQLTPGGTARR